MSWDAAAWLMLGDLGLDHRDHRAAREPDAAGDARARVSPDHGDRPADGNRCGGYAHSSFGLDGAARKPLRHLDFEALDRRHRTRPDPKPRLRRLHRGAREDESLARTGRELYRVPRLGEIPPLLPVRGTAGLD